MWIPKMSDNYKCIGILFRTGHVTVQQPLPNRWQLPFLLLLWLKLRKLSLCKTEVQYFMDTLQKFKKLVFDKTIDGTYGLFETLQYKQCLVNNLNAYHQNQVAL